MRSGNPQKRSNSSSQVDFWPRMVAAVPDEPGEVGTLKNDLTRRVRLISGLGWLHVPDEPWEVGTLKTI